MDVIKKNSPISNIVQENKELDSICADLGVEVIKFLPSPKVQSTDNNKAGYLAKHATAMLKIYKRHLNGDNTAPIKEIFTD
jgi:hypothetical protein